MTVITPTLLDELPNEWRVTRWQGISTGDTIEALFMPMLAAEVIMHSKGTFAGGTELTIEGSNEDVSASFVGLRDPQGVLISMTAKDVRSVADTPLYFKPAIASGAADSVDVLLLERFA